LLDIVGLSAGYGDVQILKDINLRANQGDVIAVIGPNGAGKTTLVKAVMGLNTIHGGHIMFQGEDLTSLPVHERARRGIALATGEIFPEMTVRENLLLGGNLVSTPQPSLEHVYRVFPRLDERRSEKATSLSGGERRMLVVGKALVGKPKLLMLDEPSAGLSPLAALGLYRTLRETAVQTTVLLEQNVRLAFSLCRYGYVLEQGRVTMQGEVSDLKDDRNFKAKYFGI